MAPSPIIEPADEAVHERLRVHGWGARTSMGAKVAFLRTPLVLPDISPHRRGKMSGRTEGGNVEHHRERVWSNPARSCHRPPHPEIQLGDDRIVGQRCRRSLMPQQALDEDDGAVGDGQRGLHVLLDQDDGDA